MRTSLAILALCLLPIISYAAENEVDALARLAQAEAERELAGPQPLDHRVHPRNAFTCSR